MLARERAKELLKKKFPKGNVTEAETGKKAIELLLTGTFDLVLLDIQLTDITGFEVLMEIPEDNRPPIIFITAFDEFAINAFEVKAIDFLLKPYKDDRFYEAISRIKKNNETSIEELINYLNNIKAVERQNKGKINNVVIKKGNSYYFVPTSSIKYITSSAYYAEIFTQDGAKHVYRISMSDFIEILDDSFIRVNRSSILKRDEIDKVISEGMGDYSIIMRDTKTFNLSKNYREAFLSSMKIRNKQ